MQVRGDARPFPIEPGIPARIDRDEIRRGLARRVPLLQMFLALSVLLTVGAFSLPAYSTGQDFVEDYVSGRALLAGTNPYAPLNELLRHYVPGRVGTLFAPQCAPSAAGVARAPLCRAAVSIGRSPLARVQYLPARAGRPNARPPGMGRDCFPSPGRRCGPRWCSVARKWFCWCSSWQRGKWPTAIANSLAGTLLGFAAALKLFPLLFFVPYLARRRLRLVAAGAVTVSLTQIVNLALVGPNELYRYYFQSLPAFNQLFVGTEVNVTPYGALLRLFGGASDVRPLVSAPVFAQILAFVIALTALYALARLCPRPRRSPTLSRPRPPGRTTSR